MGTVSEVYERTNYSEYKLDLFSFFPWGHQLPNPGRIFVKTIAQE